MKAIPSYLSILSATAILSVCLCAISGVVYSQSNNRNYILTRTFTNSAGTAYQDKVDYFDGLGRPEQSVLKNASLNNGDIVTLQEYDNLGRESNLWNPVGIASNSGQYISPENIRNRAISTYGDSRPYSMPVYESSPLNRLWEQYGPGEDWHSNSRSVKTSYLSNVAGNDTLNCICYSVSEVLNDTILTLIRGTNYASSELFVTRMEDEDGNASFEFKDKLGQVILTRNILRNGTGKEILDTYFVYNEFGKLIAVLPPEAANIFKTGSSSSWRSDTDATLLRYAFLYKYDKRKLPVAKKLPGCSWTFYIYDQGKRLVFSQDGNLRKRGEWAFSIPDRLGKECFSGICRNTFNALAEPLSSVVIEAQYSTTSASYKGYNLSGISLVSPTLLRVNYYNDYSFLGKNGIPSGTDASAGYDVGAESEGFGVRYTESAQGLLTGVLTAQLDNSGVLGYLYSVMYYDVYGRVIQAKSNNHLQGGVEKEYVVYDFVGQPVKRKHIHSATGKVTQTEVYSYTYDRVGRLLTTTHQLNGSTPVMLVSNQYDETGRLVSNQRNGNSSLKTNYTYNVRSWMKGISGTLFSESLYYNDKRTNKTNVSRYNGNISGMDWIASDNKSRGYDFTYDNLSRLIRADYLEGNARSDKFNTTYSYDKQGNMLTLSRRGNVGTTTYGTIDNLTLAYNGNQLLSVEDTGTHSSLSTSMDFKDGQHQTIEYTYDGNGNQTKDLNKSISKIEYNVLNLPSKITFSGANNPVNGYVYSAGGDKLSVIHKSSTEKRTDYVGNMIYENGSLKRLVVDGGYVENGVYHFYLQDHLGNNRVVAKADGTVVQTNHYYPYGMSFGESTYEDKQPYKYSGKELDTANGLNLYDFAARPLDVIRGQFTGIDFMAEKYYDWSPYVYCANNPILFIDPTGLAWRPTYDEKHDGSRIYNGYEWVSEKESYNENGSLRIGLYAQAIFFSDNGTFNASKRQNIGSSTATVYLADGTTQTFDASTNPSDPKIFATVPEGIYHATVGIHNGSNKHYTALKMRDMGAKSQVIELGKSNPAYSDGRTYAIGIDIHKAGLKNYTGLLKGGRHGVSQGCLLIDINNWTNFIDKFNNNTQKSNIVSVTVSRTFAIPVDINRLPAFNFFMNGSRYNIFNLKRK